MSDARLWWTLVAAFFVVTVASNPFRHLDASGHFYLSVLETLDPELFPDDEAAETLGRFSSVFFSALGFAAERAGAGPEDLERILHALHLVYRLLLVVAVLGLVRSLRWPPDQEIWLFVVFMAWCSHRKGSPLGGLSLLESTMTHREVALLLLLWAVSLLLRGRRLAFWLVVSACLWIHATRTVNFLFVALPPLLVTDFFRERRLPWRPGDRADAGGLALLLGSALAFYLLLAPPPMAEADARDFLDLKGKMSHVSPFSQPPLGWLTALGGAALACVAAWRELRSDPKALLVAGFVVSGTVFGALRGLQAAWYPTVLAAQLVPMRIFFWVWLFAFFLVSMAAVRRRGSPIGAVLLGVVLLSILGSLWLLPFVFLALCYYALEGAVRGVSGKALLERLLVVGLSAGVLGMAVFFVLGERQPFESFREPLPVVLGVGLLALAAASSRMRPRPRGLAVAGLVVLALFGASLTNHRKFAAKYGTDWADWTEVGRWCRENTAKDARFITPPGTGSFRNVAFRTPVNESRSELIWVAPPVYARNQEYSLAVKRTLAESGGTAELLCLASGWGVSYVITGADLAGSGPALFRAGRYVVYPVPEAACG